VAVGAKARESRSRDSSVDVIEVERSDIGESAFVAPVTTPACGTKCFATVMFAEIAIRAGCEPTDNDALRLIEVQLRLEALLPLQVDGSAIQVQVPQRGAQAALRFQWSGSYAVSDCILVVEKVGVNSELLAHVVHLTN
jgi:hypothetical protein